MQNTEFTCPQCRNEFWQTKYKPSLCTSLCWKSALHKMSKKIKKKIVRKNNLRLERTRSNTPKYVGHKNSDVCKHMPRETERILQGVELWPNSISESQLAGREFTWTSSTQFSIVFITQTDDESFSRSFFGVLGRQRLCWLAVAVNNVPTTANWWTHYLHELLKQINIHKLHVVMIFKKIKWSILILHKWKGSTQRHLRKSRD